MTLLQKRLAGLGLMVLLGGLAALAVYWQQKKTLSADDEKKAEEKVLRVANPDDVTSLAMQSAKGRFVLARQNGASWRLVEPIATAADEVTVNALARHLAELRRTRLVGEPTSEGGVTPPADLSIFGLAPARFEITLTRKDGQSETLLVGGKNDFDGSIYVKTPDAADVQLVAGGLDYQIDKDLMALREKRLAVFEPSAVARLLVEAGPHSYMVERSGEGFVLKRPLNAAADQSQIDGILQALSGMRADAFLSEHATAKDLAAHGLHQPAARVEITLKSGASIDLVLAERKEGDRTLVYAALKGDSPLVEMSSDWALRRLFTPVADLRDKRVVRFDRDAVRAISITKGAASLSLARRRQGAEEEERWFITTPEPGDADDSVVSGLVYRLWSLRARKVVAEEASDTALRAHGLDEPSAIVELLGEGGAALATLRLRETGGTWHATASTTGRIDEVASDEVSDLSVVADDYKPRTGDQEE